MTHAPSKKVAKSKTKTSCYGVWQRFLATSPSCSREAER